MPAPRLKLATTFTPARDGEALVYGIELTNLGTEPLAQFKLGINGPARIDTRSEVEGGVLLERLSNHSLFAPPPGFVLAPGATWTIAARGLSYPLRHWSDGANAAYVVLADGTSVRVETAPTEATGSNAPLLKGAMRFAVPNKVPASISVIPWPQKVAVTGAAPVPPGLDLRPEGDDAVHVAGAFAALTSDLFPVEGIVRPAAEGGLPVRVVAKAGFGPEAYAVAFSESGVLITATTRTGMLYGLITLGQILRGATQYPDRLTFPTGGSIEDEPALGWRGTHLDVARQFYSTAEVERLLKLIAWSKMNRFHWHLSEDEAWRVEIEAYPALTSIGAWRGYGKALPPLLGSGAQPTGGYYSKAAIRQIVALGQSLGIQIVPEIDMPGHCYAALQSLPELRDPNETGEYLSVQGFPNNCLNPAHGNVVDKKTTYLVGWRSVEINAALAADGYDIVVSPGQRYYLDMANSLSWSEPGAGWAGWSGPQETYEFDPREGMGAEQQKHLLGVQSCIWSEPMTDRAIFDRLVFPRISAIAETGWTRPENKSWARFSAFASLMPIMYGNWADPQA